MVNLLLAPEMLSAAPSTAQLLGRARAMLRAGRVHAARALLNALRRMQAAPAELAELEASLLLREGRAAEAVPVLDAAIIDFPGRPGLHLGRADARLQTNDLVGAVADAADAVMLDPADPAAKASLGVALIELQDYADAAACLTEAVQAAPGHAAYHQGLAEAQERGGDAQAAAATLVAAVALIPDHAGLRIAAIMVEMRRRDFAAAAALAEQARACGQADACVFGLAGHALSSLGRHEEALSAYAEALKLAPEDPYVRHMVVSGGMGLQGDRAPPAYLETVFDGYAAGFDAHLISLGYRVPGLIRAALLADGPGFAAAGPVLDLGCGTGLLAVALSDLKPGPWTGVDLSGGMLARARDRGLYAELVQSDLETMLGDAGAAWGLILAGDVLCYFGALDKVLSLAAPRLAPAGRLVFTVEALAPDVGVEWRLGRQGRYAHDAGYVAAAAAAAGLAVRTLRPEVLRHEGGTPVDGLLVVLEAPR